MCRVVSDMGAASRALSNRVDTLLVFLSLSHTHAHTHTQSGHSLGVSLSLTHTRTHTHTHTHTRTHTHTPPYLQRNPPLCWGDETHTHTHTHTHTPLYAALKRTLWCCVDVVIVSKVVCFFLFVCLFRMFGSGREHNFTRPNEKGEF